MSFSELTTMTLDDWTLLGIVIVILALPSIIKPLSNKLGRALGFVPPTDLKR